MCLLSIKDILHSYSLPGWSKNPRRSRDHQTVFTLILKSILISALLLYWGWYWYWYGYTCLIQKSKTSASIGLDVKTRGFQSRQWYRHKRYLLQIIFWINFSLANININQYIFLGINFHVSDCHFCRWYDSSTYHCWQKWTSPKSVLPSARDVNNNNLFW